MTKPGWKVTAWTPDGPVVARGGWTGDALVVIAPSARLPMGEETPTWTSTSCLLPAWPKTLDGLILGIINRDALEGPFRTAHYGGVLRNCVEYGADEPLVFSVFAEAALGAGLLVYEPPPYGFPMPEQLLSAGADICDLKGHRVPGTSGEDEFAVVLDGHSAFYSSSSPTCSWKSYWLRTDAPASGADVADYFNTLRTLTRRDAPTEAKA